MPNWGMVVDLDRCTGCEACIVACHAENNIPTVGPLEAAKGRAHHWIRVERYWEGEYPEIKARFLPVFCQHCEAAPCETVCPVSDLSALAALVTGALFPLIHLGRPGLFYALIPIPNARRLWPNFHSPLLWDFLGVNAYLSGNVALFYCSLLSGLKNGQASSLFRGKISLWIRLVSGRILDFKGHAVLAKATRIIAFLLIPAALIPVAISIHLTASLNGLTQQDSWTIYLFSGMQFLVGSLLAGVALLMVYLILTAHFFVFEPAAALWLQCRLKRWLEYLIAAWVVFSLIEGIYSNSSHPLNQALLQSKLSGIYSGLFWRSVLFTAVIPSGLLLLMRRPGQASLFAASVSILAGQWMEKLLLIVNRLSHPLLTYNAGAYRPSGVEICIVISAFAVFGLTFFFARQLLPEIAAPPGSSEYDYEHEHLLFKAQQYAEQA